jgi:hypothetical protein
MGELDGQSPLVRHAVQRFPGPQRFPERSAQSESPAHCTQTDVAVLHTGVSPEHCAAEVQPVRHLFAFASHTSESDPQSPLDSHSTHTPVAAWHRGWSAGHEVLLAHPTHCRLAWLHVAPTPQSMVAQPGRHPTQRPTVVAVLLSQM